MRMASVSKSLTGSAVAPMATPLESRAFGYDFLDLAASHLPAGIVSEDRGCLQGFWSVISSMCDGMSTENARF